MGPEENYRHVLKIIHDKARNCGRDPHDIKLIVVSKGQPSQSLQELIKLGIRDYGENRLPEAFEKMESCPKDLRWHFIGSLQKNKIRKLVGRFHLIHSVDSFDIAEKIAKTSSELGIVSPVLLQVNISKEKTKHGWSEDLLKNEFDALARLEGLKIEGLMTMAPFTDDETILRKTFKGLRTLRDALGLKELSMGMSNDYGIAIEEGATLLRIGSAIFSD